MEGGVGGGAGVPGGGALQRGGGVPGDVTLLVDEFDGGADQVGDDGEEAGVDLVLAEGAVPDRSAKRVPSRVNGPPRQVNRQR